MNKAQYNKHGIYLTDIVPNTFTTNTSSFFSKSNSADNYYFIDISHWIWPRYNPDLNNCSFSLPTFILSSSFTVHIGN